MSRLASAEVEQYHRDGFYFPIRVMSAAEALTMRRRLEAVEADNGGRLGGELRQKPHLLFTWLADLVRHPAILDPVEAVLGPNLLVWSTSFFIKEAHDPAYVSWHQDATYWGLSAPDVLTAWVAFTDATVENGAMRMVPGSHDEQLAHRDTFAPHNLLSRGQEIAVEVDEGHAVDLVLRPGQMSLHHVKIFHGSRPNRARDRRIGFAIRYLPLHIRQNVGADSATLVRGQDRVGQFALEPAPAFDLAPDAVAYHRRVRDARMAILMRDAAQASTAGHAAPAM